jgi:hypothetical protein
MSPVECLRFVAGARSAMEHFPASGTRGYDQDLQRHSKPAAAFIL